MMQCKTILLRAEGGGGSLKCSSISSCINYPIFWYQNKAILYLLEMHRNRESFQTLMQTTMGLGKIIKDSNIHYHVLTTSTRTGQLIRNKANS